MFKKIGVLLFFLATFLLNFTLHAEEKYENDDLRTLYLIKLEKNNEEGKEYTVLINDSEWFKKWASEEAQTTNKVEQKDGFIKPSYVKKVKKVKKNNT